MNLLDLYSFSRTPVDRHTGTDELPVCLLAEVRVKEGVQEVISRMKINNEITDDMCHPEHIVNWLPVPVASALKLG
jgi:hypothetical protein